MLQRILFISAPRVRSNVLFRTLDTASRIEIPAINATTLTRVGTSVRLEAVSLEGHWKLNMLTPEEFADRITEEQAARLRELLDRRQSSR